jgi:hypothetical protein
MIEINEMYSHLDKLGELFMNQFKDKEPMSLDEFLEEYYDELTQEQRDLGYYISGLFESIRD